MPDNKKELMMKRKILLRKARSRGKEESSSSAIKLNIDRIRSNQKMPAEKLAKNCSKLDMHTWISNQTDVNEENVMSTQSQVKTEMSKTIKSIEKEFEELERKTMSLTPLPINKDTYEFNEADELSIKILEAEELIRRHEINQIKIKEQLKV